MITFNTAEKLWKIETKNTCYAMKIVYGKYVGHVYYGAKDKFSEEGYKEIFQVFSPYQEEIGDRFSLATVPTELSFFDSGDVRDTGVKIQNANGDCTTLFCYKSHRTFQGRIPFENMPYSKGADETLEIVYEDAVSGCELYTYYSVFEDSDTITRYAKFVNKGEKPVQIRQATVAQLDVYQGEYTLVTLCGDYFKERAVTESPVHIGIQRIYSKRGHSSHQFNPFIALKEVSATEDEGDAYAMEFVYSGDFEAQAERGYQGNIRLMIGLNRDTFSWLLEKDEEFWTPEVIFTYSNRGTNGLSQNLHNHIRAHVIPKKFVYAPRPTVINTWEAMYFNIDEDILLEYAKKGKELGMDTLVVDDGWFGERNDDTIGLGDWYVNKAKFKNGLKSFSEKVHSVGMHLGIWIEPEMVNPQSAVCKRHPEWVLQCKNRPSSLSRQQLVFDLTNDEVIDYIVGQIKETLSDVPLEYIKWDFNRSLSESGSLFLPAERQGEAKHRFVLGSYKMHKKLTEAFPNVLFEGCSGGGGRFDAGILFYCPQIWTSDNTDPVERLTIQKGTAWAYPASAISAHVSNSRSNALETSPDYNFRYNVALGGVLGYEMNILRLSPEDEEKVKAQTEENRKLQPLILRGDQYRMSGLNEGEFGQIFAAKDRSECLLVYQNVGKAKRERVYLKGLDSAAMYQTDNGEKYLGKALMEEGVPLPSDCRYIAFHFHKTEQ